MCSIAITECVSVCVFVHAQTHVCISILMIACEYILSSVCKCEEAVNVSIDLNIHIKCVKTSSLSF